MVEEKKCFLIPISVMNYKASEILQANRLVCYSSMNAGRKHETAEPVTNGGLFFKGVSIAIESAFSYDIFLSSCFLRMMRGGYVTPD